MRRVSTVLFAALVAACGSSTADTTTTTQPTTTTTTPAPAVVEITAVDYAFVGVPESVPVGTRLALANDSDVEVHELVAIWLPDDETRPVSELVQLPPDEMAAFFPLVETVVIAPPAADGLPVEGTGELTRPGRYALICVIPTGADPDEYLAAAAESEGGPPEVAGGPPHIVHGMFVELEVTG